jgi:hypothetical protein
LSAPLFCGKLGSTKKEPPRMSREEEIRKAYKDANAIVALAGWEPPPGALAIQERVIKGELTPDEAIQAHVAQVLEEYSKSHPAPTTREGKP